MAVGRFGKAFLTSLKENRPQEYQRLAANGRLQQYAESVDRRAQEMFESTLSQLMRQKPGPQNSLEKAQHLNTLAEQARELVLDDVLIRSPEEELAENPPPDPGPEELDRESARLHSRGV